MTSSSLTNVYYLPWLITETESKLTKEKNVEEDVANSDTRMTTYLGVVQYLVVSVAFPPFSKVCRQNTFFLMGFDIIGRLRGERDNDVVHCTLYLVVVDI